MKPYLGWPWFSLSLPRADAAAIWVGHYRERREDRVFNSL